MIAGVYNINIDQGATFERLITVKNPDGTLYDFSGYTARMHIRAEMEDTDYLAILTTENGRLLLGGAAGTIEINIPSDVTAILRRNCVYDIELIAPVTGKVYRLLKGIVRVSDEVTR